jgi:hypothetical protein
MRRLFTAGLFFVAMSGALSLRSSSIAAGEPRNQPAVTLRDLDGRAVDPFRASEGSRAIVFLFTSTDCPISNRYAPAVARLYDAFATKGVSFWLVYPNPAESPQAIREHVRAYNYPTHVLRDPKHDLVRLSRVSVTPEAAVYDANGTLVYHGRIDNRYVNLGVERPAATEHDLEDVLSAVAAGKPSPKSTAAAVGCFIADFVNE